MKHALEELTDPERNEIVQWLLAFQEHELANHFAPGGPAQFVFDELNREIDEGKTQPMDEACREQRRAGLK